MAQKLAGHQGLVTALEFSPDGGRLLSTGQDEAVQLWDATSGKQLLDLARDKHLGAIRSARFLAGGTQVLTASFLTKAALNGKVVNESSVHVFDARTGSDLLPKLKHGHGAQFAVASSDSKYIAAVADGYERTRSRGVVSIDSSSGASNGSGTVQLWNAATGERIAGIPNGSAEDRPLQFSPDGRRLLLMAPNGGTVRVYDVLSGRELFSLRTAVQVPRAAYYSPNGRWIVALADRRSLALFHAGDGTAAGSIEGLPADATQAAFQPDGQRLAVTCDSVAAICDLAARKITAELKSHEGPIDAVAFSPDGKQVLTASRDQTAALWDAQTGRMAALYRGHTAAVTHVAFSHDNQRVATAAANGSVRIWPRDLWAEVQRRKSRDFTPEERSRYEIAPTMSPGRNEGTGVNGT